MLSVCIGIYNYDVNQLVKDLCKQADKLGIEYEILLLDDASKHDYLMKNAKLDFLPHVTYLQNYRNVGRSVIRNLILEDPGDILNCGIEIRVQPPGKSLRTLTLLSGGERAFVAIALYFAMLKVRPAPFCVLDEIESALDENNVIRFAQYTRSMSDHTQFLIITHRRGTMENADELYGVTMQKGISRVLRVALDDALKTGTG